MGEANKDSDRKEENESHFFVFKVNGIQLQSKSERITAHDVLTLAKSSGAIPDNPENYILEGDKGDYRNGDCIDLEQDNIFITIPNTPTPVA